MRRTSFLTSCGRFPRGAVLNRSPTTSIPFAPDHAYTSFMKFMHHSRFDIVKINTFYGADRVLSRNFFKKCKQTRMAHVHPRRRSNKLVNERRLRSSYFYHFMRHGCVCDFSSTSSVYNVSLLDISNKINFIRHASCWDPRKWYAKPLNTLKVSAYMRSIMLSAHFLSSHGQQIVKVATSVNAIDIEWNR